MYCRVGRYISTDVSEVTIYQTEQRLILEYRNRIVNTGLFILVWILNLTLS
jgi:hypothetical protein